MQTEVNIFTQFLLYLCNVRMVGQEISQLFGYKYISLLNKQTKSPLVMFAFSKNAFY